MLSNSAALKHSSVFSSIPYTFILHFPHFSLAPFPGILNFIFPLIYIISVHFSFMLWFFPVMNSEYCSLLFFAIPCRKHSMKDFEARMTVIIRENEGCRRYTMAPCFTFAT